MTRSERKTFFWVFGLATLCALSLRLFILEDFRVASASMWPSLNKGDLVFASKFSYNLHVPFTDMRLIRLGEPERGEIVLFGVPGLRGKTYLKRVVAVGGDTLEIKQGKLLINGESRRVEGEDRRLATATLWGESVGKVRYSVVPAGLDYGPINIPEEHFFALGDNRANSKDSRVWGPIPNSFLRGAYLATWKRSNSGTH